MDQQTQSIKYVFAYQFFILKIQQISFKKETHILCSLLHIFLEKPQWIPITSDCNLPMALVGNVNVNKFEFIKIKKALLCIHDFLNKSSW